MVSWREWGIAGRGVETADEGAAAADEVVASEGEAAATAVDEAAGREEATSVVASVAGKVPTMACEEAVASVHGREEAGVCVTA